MIDLLVKVAVNAVALIAAANVVPDFRFVFHTDRPEDWLKIAVIASSSPLNKLHKGRS